MDYKLILSSIGIGLAVISYVIYFRDILRGHTKPHAFSWFVWAILELTNSAILFSAGAGAASWINGVSGLLCLVVAIIGLKQKVQLYTLTDKVALSLALIAIVLWWQTGQPEIAVLLVVCADLCGFIPTFRKSFHNPWEESVSMYLISAIKYGIILLALERYQFTTWFYPTVILTMDVLLVMVLLVYRKKLPKQI